MASTAATAAVDCRCADIWRERHRHTEIEAKNIQYHEGRHEQCGWARKQPKKYGHGAS
jgi:hypothetical protein